MDARGSGIARAVLDAAIKYRRSGTTDFVEHTYGMDGMLLGNRPTVRGVWTPTPDEQLADELQAALARPIPVPPPLRLTALCQPPATRRRREGPGPSRR